MTTAQRQPLSKLLRVAISIFLIGHLLAVFLPPLSFQTRGPLGPSPSVATAFAPFEWYSQFLYIDRGYAFFAPDPGPSHLIQAAVIDGNGQQVEIRYPDLAQQRPRLLYHRHFMLTEFLDEIYEPPGPPAELIELDRDEAESWVRARARYEHVRQSVVEHLKNKHPGKQVAIQRLEHLIPDVIEFQREPIALDDPRLYQVILDRAIDFDAAGNLAEPTGPPESIPPPEGAAPDSNERETDSSDKKQRDEAKPQEETPVAEKPETETPVAKKTDTGKPDAEKPDAEKQETEQPDEVQPKQSTADPADPDGASEDAAPKREPVKVNDEGDLS